MKKILVVEDDPVQQQRLCDVLKQVAANVTVVSNGSEAVAKAKDLMPDLILMDIIMPEMDGYAACRSITKDAATKHIPVVIVSSKNQEADKVWAQLQGAKALIGKPYQDEDILEQARAYL